MHLLYGSRGLNKVALGNFDFFQYSSEGEPQSLYILCSCSTCVKYSRKGLENMMEISNNQKMCLMQTPQNYVRDVITKHFF